MLTCWNAPKINNPPLAPSLSSTSATIQALHAIFGDQNLKKSILSLFKTFGGFLDKAAVTKVVNDIGKATLGVPFVGLGVQALVLIVNNVAAFEDNQTKADQIKQSAEFLQKYIKDIDNKENEDTLHEFILRILQNAWILQHNIKEREGYGKRVWGCVKAFACAQPISSTLDHVAIELQQLQRNLNTILLAQANSRQLHFLKNVELDYDQALYKVGLEDRINTIMKFFKSDAAVNRLRAVGVYGIGGIGKSTLLFGLRHHLAKQGDEYIVALEMLNKDSSIKQVQENLIKQITRSSIEFHDEGEGQSYLATELKFLKQKQKKVCLILDNLTPSQSNMVSKILPDPIHINEYVTYLIVSAREMHVVERVCKEFTTDKNDYNLYEPSLLNEEEAKLLFCKKAKIESHSALDLISNIVPLLGGLPLALEVYGSYFGDEKKRKADEWKNVMKKIVKAQDVALNDQEKVFNKIETSLDLYEQDKQIQLTDFMDAALFWKDKPWEEAQLALLWEEDEDGLSRLEEKSLASNKSIYDSGKLHIHDILVNVAKKKAESEKCTYYHVAQDNVYSQLTDQKIKEEHIRGVTFKDASVVSATLIEKMDSLKFLNIEGCRLYVPPSIMKLHPRWIILTFLLYLGLIIPLIKYFLAKYFSISILFLLLIFLPTLILIFVYLFPSSILPSRMLTTTGGQLLPKSLTYLRIHDCFDTISLSHSIGQLTQLRSLILSRNHGFQGNLPSSIFSNLGKLHLLNLSTCPDIANIPTSISNLISLRTLNLSSCAVLGELPSSLGDLKNLESINLSDCHLLTCLPQTIGNLKQLQYLKMSNCDALSSLPSSFGHLESLQMLDLSRSDRLERLPPSFTKLHALQSLNMSYCSGLKNLPEDFGNLTSLKHLNISKCSNLIGLPASMSKLKNLQSLDASHCISLHDVGFNLFEPLKSTLKDLDLTACSKLKIEMGDTSEGKHNWKLEQLDLQRVILM